MTHERKHQPDQAADALVIFGITGDLAKVMTFRSLYRLERRGLLHCPIIGVAVEDWTVGRPRRAGPHVDRGDRRAARRGRLRPTRRLGCDYVQGDLTEDGDLRPGGRAVDGAARPGLLPRDPAVPLRHGRQGARRGGPDRGTHGWWSRSPSVTTWRPPAALAEELHEYRRRVAALPDRPLPREDGPRGDPLPSVRQHDAGADLEPQLRRVHPDHDGRGLRRRDARALLRPGRRAARRRRQPPAAAPGRSHDGGTVGGDPETLRDAQTAVLRSIRRSRPEPVRPRPVRRLRVDRRASPRARRPRPTARCGSRSRTGGGRGFRSSSAPASSSRSPRPSCGWCSSSRRHWASGCAGPTANRTSSWCGSTRRPASGSSCRHSAPTRRRPERSISTWTSRPPAARDRRPTRCCCTQR